MFYISQYAGELRRDTADGTLAWSRTLPDFQGTWLTGERGMCCGYGANENGQSVTMLGPAEVVGAITSNVPWPAASAGRVGRPSSRRCRRAPNSPASTRNRTAATPDSG